MAIIDMQIITCIIWLKSLDLLFYIIIIVSLYFFLVLTCVILSLYRSKRRPPDSEWGGHWEHSQPWKILIINIALLSLLLLLSLSLLLKMNGEDTRGIVGKSVWNSTYRNLQMSQCNAMQHVSKRRPLGVQTSHCLIHFLYGPIIAFVASWMSHKRSSLT